jgi:LysM repeat protein
MRRFSLLVLLFSFAFFLQSYAYADTTYKVKKGDSLYKISKKFGISIDEIKIRNEITSSRIQPGTKLSIPTGYKNQNSEPSVQSSVITPGQETPVTMSEDLICHHIVEKGDTLLTISKKYSVSVRDIREFNHLRSTKIKPGQRLLLREIKPGEQPRKYDAVISETKKEKENSKNKAEYHMVRKGDTLSSISKKYSIPVSEIRELNDLKSRKLNPKQQLLIRKIGQTTYIVRKGDSIYKIARKFSINIDELKNINGLETERLKPGQKLLLESETEQEELTNYKAVLSEEKIEGETWEGPKPDDLPLKDRLILFAKKFIDIPYRFGGNSIFGIDCSGYVQKVYRMVGINLPRSAREQFHEGKPVNTGELSIGDLVFFRTYASFPSHVGIYLGDNLFIHASSKGKKVTIDRLTEPFYIKRFIGAKRVIGEDALGGG